MSLINDALKRAAQKPASPPSASELASGLRPSEERANGFPVLTLLIVLIPLIALGVWFLAKGLQLDEQPTTVSGTVASAREPEPPAAPLARIVVLAPTNTPLAAPAAATVYKLQGIYWRPTRPSAVVNSRTVYVGDRVENARVTAIDHESVTLSVNGESKVLLMP